MAKILSGLGRAGMGRVFDPIARALLRAHISPDAVTVAGTLGVLIGAIGFGARGQFVAGTFIVTLSTFADLVDGSMARQSGRAGRFGAFLDSTMDRVADGAVFGAVAYWLATQDRHWALVAALICLVTGQIVSYAKARAESLGMTANVGIAAATHPNSWIDRGCLALAVLGQALPNFFFALILILLFAVTFPVLVKPAPTTSPPRPP